MIQFLTTVFDPLTTVIKTKLGDLFLQKFSVFEGIKETDLPKLEDLIEEKKI